ncbi:MAG TPA: TIR domain-containing protein [Caulobacteraceae bacterium]
MSDIFISYARSTADQAQAVAQALRGLGYDVWRDDELPAHRAYAEVIEERLTAAKVVVVIWSAEAVRSEWVQSEADTARTDHKLVQLTVDGTKLPRPFDRIQCADMTGWAGEADAPGWRKVIASVAELVGGEAPSAAEVQPAARKLSVCVLPFANMSDDPQQEYFSDGISEDVITDLSKVSALFVVARNTAFTFKGKSVKVPDVARELAVSHVLEGSVRKAGGRVRITAQLIDGATGGHIWAERYDRDLTDIFALQDEISEAIVAALKLKLLPQEKASIERRGTDSVEAYNLYLMARRFYIDGAGDERNCDAYGRLCGRAVAIDPNYANAWALLAAAQGRLRRQFGREGDGGSAAVERALALDPDLAEAHAAKVGILAEAGRPEEAVAEIATALRLDGESYEVNIAAGSFMYRKGRVEEAAPFFEKAVTVMEADYGTPGLLVSCYTALGDLDNARRAARITVARTEINLAQDPSNGTAISYAACALAALGEAERAGDYMDRALLIDPDNRLMRYNFACALVALKDPDGALAMLGPALEQDPGGMVRDVRTDPDFDDLRDDPRFEAMIAQAEARLAGEEAAALP